MEVYSMKQNKVIEIKEKQEYIEPHTCPYNEEIHGDSETLCTCTPEQERECLWDI
jgi:hypothetical protein